MFIDKAEIVIKSGKGGNGSVSFRREANIPMGGPDGGNGGRGGNVVLLADRNLRTLMDFRYKTKYEAANGEGGRGRNQYGADGEDLIIKVPVGTLVKDKTSGLVIADLKKDKQQVIAAKGGKGGKGNAMYKSSIRQAPNFAEAGGASREVTVELELKLIADVGLVGYPNVGKSTLLSVSTSANPKIANYHFTTLTPNLGVVNMYERSFVMADIPGLIEGASQGAGLGLDFLKHIERTRVLIHIVDISGSEGRDPKEDFEKINAELFGYSKKLMEKPMVVVANKMDMAPAGAYEEFKTYIESKGLQCYAMCAPIHQGVEEVLRAAYQLLVSLGDEPEEEIVSTYQASGVETDEDYRDINVEYDGSVYVVTGKQLEKIFNSTNFTDDGSLRYLYRYVEDNGAIDRAIELGMQDGDTLRIISYDFEYTEE